MLSKTHLACGIAASLAILQPQTPKGMAAAVIGGALGGSVPDIDTIKSRTSLDSVITQGAALLIAAGAVFLDWYFHFGILSYLGSHPESAATGAVLYLILVIIGFYAPHRGFTHSILAMLLFTAAVRILYPGAADTFAVGYLSHLALDLLNRKPLELLFPVRRGLCLKLCYSNRMANRIFFAAGCILSAVLLFGGVLHYLSFI